MSMPEGCRLCPRRCNVKRSAANGNHAAAATEEKGPGYCLAGETPLLAKAMLHFWEEPCISGKEGSGALFFSGCSLGCVFCQNHAISGVQKRGNAARRLPGRPCGIWELRQRFDELFSDGANNINLVTGDIYIPVLSAAIREAKNAGFPLPFVWNTGSYVNPEALSCLDGLVDVYLPDLKFFSVKKAARYANASDYPETARAAIAEMVRQTGSVRFDERGMLKKGVLVRHLLLPGGLLEAKLIVRYLFQTYGNRIWLSLMNQYTPIVENLTGFPELMRKVTPREYDSLLDYALKLGVEQAYMQEGETAKESFIPFWDM